MAPCVLGPRMPMYFYRYDSILSYSYHNCTSIVVPCTLFGVSVSKGDPCPQSRLAPQRTASEQPIYLNLPTTIHTIEPPHNNSVVVIDYCVSEGSCPSHPVSNERLLRYVFQRLLRRLNPCRTPSIYYKVRRSSLDWSSFRTRCK